MAELETCLFIGGPVDGERLNVTANAAVWQVREPQRLDGANRWPPDFTKGTRTIRTAVYERMSFQTGERILFLFVLRGETAETTMLRLLKGYKPSP
jgi:hypothetical protein